MSSSTLKRPATEPVVRAGTIAGAVAGLIVTLGGLARALGWLTDDVDVNAIAMQASNLILGAGVLWSTLAPLVLAMWARGKVTPLADPRDRHGTPFVVRGSQMDSQVDSEMDTEMDNGTDSAPDLVSPWPVVTAMQIHVRADEPTPIAAQVAAALTDTQPAMQAIRR